MRITTTKFILPALFCTLFILSQSLDTFSQTTDINAKDETGQTLLMTEAQDGTAANIKKLLKKGANIELKDQYGWTALMYAAFSNIAVYPKTKPDTSMLKALLEASANANVSDPRGITPLIIAANEGKTEFVKLLLSKGADANAKDQKGATALSYAKAKGHRDVIILLEKAGAAAGIALDKDKLPERIGPIDVMPKRLNFFESRARYTEEARMNNITGVVRFRVLVGADGSIKKAKLISGLPYGLTEQAMQGVKKIKIEPGMHEGKPVDYWMAIQYTFSIY